jgi:hypothetical protein
MRRTSSKSISPARWSQMLRTARRACFRTRGVNKSKKKDLLGAYIFQCQKTKSSNLTQSEINLIKESFDLRDGVVHDDKRDLAACRFPLTTDVYNQCSSALKKLFHELRQL